MPRLGEPLRRGGHQGVGGDGAAAEPLGSLRDLSYGMAIVSRTAGKPAVPDSPAGISCSTELSPNTPAGTVCQQGPAETSR